MKPLDPSLPIGQLLLSLVAEPTRSTIDRAAWQPIIPTLALQILADERRASAFDIQPETVRSAVERRLELLRTVYPILQQFCQSWSVPATTWLETAWNLWLPLAIDVHDRRQALDRPFVQGILGGQGTGKTTLGAVLTRILAELGDRTLSWSIDDLYKTYAVRQRLREQDPRLIWRGPPGTHDVELGVQILDHLRQKERGTPIALPRFDKSLWQGAGDRTTPELITNVDIVLFEGWFVGVRPIDPIVLATAPEPIRTEFDRAFARDTNLRLQAYLPLWERLDRLLVLYPVDYRFSQQWRKQAEQEMRAIGKAGMNDAEIAAFVEYFWQALHPELFIKPLVTQADGADLVIEIDANHVPGAVYRPGDRS
jgi:D-glycerate 3-kinase